MILLLDPLGVELSLWGEAFGQHSVCKGIHRASYSVSRTSSDVISSLLFFKSGIYTFSRP